MLGHAKIASHRPRPLDALQRKRRLGPRRPRQPPRTRQDVIRLTLRGNFSAQAWASRTLSNFGSDLRPTAQADLLRCAIEAALGAYLQEEVVLLARHLGLAGPEARSWPASSTC